MSSPARTAVRPVSVQPTSVERAANPVSRQCHCGNHSPAGVPCRACAGSDSPLQPKLAIGRSNDPLEREADRLAEQALSGPLHGQATSAALGIRRRSSEDAVSSAPARVEEILRAPGHPLDAGTRRFFEARFGHDFSQVRVHDDARSAESAQAVGALAYTVGSDVVFAAGQYRPHLPEGRKLLAHELAHTLQQRSAPALRPKYPDSQRAGADEPVIGVSVSSGPVVIARQNQPNLKQQIDELNRVPGPSPDATQQDQDNFQDANSKATGREKINAPSTWGWGSPETNNQYQECNCVGMPRERFLAFEATLPKGPPRPQRRRPSDGPKMPLGATWPDLANAVAPKIAAEMIEEGGQTLYRIKPTFAGMAPIKSAHTQAGIFQEGVISFMVFQAGGGRVCPNLGGIAPQFWQVTEAGAKKIWAGEMEHCSDIRAAFDRTLVLYASVINNEAAAERRYSSAKRAVDATKQRLSGIPQDPIDMLNSYGREIEKTRRRDTSHWHDGIVSSLLTPQQNNCRGYLGTFDDKSFPEVGDGPKQEKHPPEEIMDDQSGSSGKSP